jgi:hypothetical protein
MSEPRLPKILRPEIRFNQVCRKRGGIRWLHAVAPVLKVAERQQGRRYLQALLRDERGEPVIVPRGRKFGGQSCGATSRSDVGAAAWPVALAGA